jgi:hypothetical protein
MRYIRIAEPVPIAKNNMRLPENIPPFFVVLAATCLEVCGDAIVRTSIYSNHTGLGRIVLMALGAALLFGYGYFINMTPLEFGKIAGMYIAILFTVWQVINYIAFKTTPSLPIIIGGSMIIAGGLIVTFSQAK